MSTAKKVEEAFLYCLFTDEEPTDNHVPAEGVVHRVGFHPARLEEKRAEVIEILRSTLVDEFYKDKGGGMSFLQLPMGRDGEIWGEHRSADQLLCLSLALGLASLPLPRQFWAMLPGGMPYITFDLPKE